MPRTKSRGVVDRQRWKVITGVAGLLAATTPQGWAVKFSGERELIAHFERDGVGPEL